MSRTTNAARIGGRNRENLVKDAHPEDFCHKCGQPNIVWFAPNELWNKSVRAANEPEILCPVCFVQLAEAAGVNAVWEVAPQHWHAEATQKSVTQAFAVIDKAIESTATTQSSDQARAAAEEIASYVGDQLGHVMAEGDRLDTGPVAAIISRHLRTAAVPEPRHLVETFLTEVYNGTAHEHRRSVLMEFADWLESRNADAPVAHCFHNKLFTEYCAACVEAFSPAVTEDKQD